MKKNQKNVFKFDPDFTYKLLSMGLVGTLIVSKNLWSIILGVIVFIYILYVESNEK